MFERHCGQRMLLRRLEGCLSKMVDSYKVIHHPIATEKAMRLIDSENKLMFVVDRRANKKQIKDAIESLFKVKVLKVNTLFMPTGQKRAYVRLGPENSAMDIITQLGMM